MSNTISFDALSEPMVAMLQSGALGRIWSEPLPVGVTDIARDVAQVCDCVPSLPQLLSGLWKHWRDRSVVSSENIERKTV